MIWSLPIDNLATQKPLKDPLRIVLNHTGVILQHPNKKSRKINGILNLHRVQIVVPRVKKSEEIEKC